ncbi:MAG: hypothetical protein ACC662_06065, partial [Planctomycetota bacterium]
MGMSPGGRALLLAAVFLTGATALAYEVAWTRGLVLLLGSTAASTAVVLAVFVGALGLGARWGGDRADRARRPLALYGVLETLAALWAVLALPLASLLAPLYVGVAAPLPDGLRFGLRVVVAALVVLPGAFLLGATLPVLVRFWVRRRDVTGRATAWLYGTNTLGAVAGALATGFFAVERFGVLGALAAAALLAGAVGLGALVVGRRMAPRPGNTATPGRTPSAPTDAGSRGLSGALAAAALCGALGLGIELVGFRILVFFVEGFTITFAAMLAVFIAGLGLGSLTLGAWLGRTRHPARALGLLLALLFGVLLVEGGFVVGRLEGWMGALKAWAYVSGGVVGGLERASLAGSALLLLAPALLLGATFPLCVRWAELAG